jgi:site-specific recombinase XerD
MRELLQNLGQLPAALRDTCLRYFELRQASLHPRTVRNNRYVVLRFIRFLSTHAPEVQNWSQLRRYPHLEDWLISRKALHPRTRLQDIQVLAQFFEDMADWGWPDIPPPRLFMETDIPRVPKGLPVPLDQDDDRRLMEVLEKDRTVMGLGLRLLRQTGLRGGELLGLPPDAVHQAKDNQYVLRVPPGETFTERLFPLTDKTRAIAEEILAKRGIETDRSQLPPFLMVNERGQKVAYYTFWRLLKKSARSAGITNWQRIHLHQLRHTFATELARTGIPLASLMTLLGHKKPDITMRYVLLTGTDIRHAYDQALAELPALQKLGRVLTVQPHLQFSSLNEEFDAFISRLDYRRRDLCLSGQNADNLTRLIKRLRAALYDLRRLS